MHMWTNLPLSRACDTHNLLLTTIPTYNRQKYGETTKVWGDSDTEATYSGVLKSYTIFEGLWTLFRVYIYEKIETRQ
jgi:hypothetical protein